MAPTISFKKVTFKINSISEITENLSMNFEEKK